VSRSRFRLDPSRITNFNLSRPQLELHLLFWVAVAGKNAHTTAAVLDRFLRTHARRAPPRATPFGIVRAVHRTGKLGLRLRQAGFGCYLLKAKAFAALVEGGLDPKTCTLEELEAVPGIGPKTARCFLLHTRPGQPYAGLDVHVLRFLQDRGHQVPKATPAGRRYRELERAFLAEAAAAGKAPAEFDLEVWNEYRLKRERDG
jgi:hypothetical protein